MSKMLLPATSDACQLLDSGDVARLLAELASCRLQIAQKDSMLALQAAEITDLRQKQKESESHSVKLEAAVNHRDAVIGQLASSRKLVFEECHRACINNETELRQMQDALHRVSRQLQRERREHASRIKEIRRGSKRSSLLPPREDSCEVMPWDDNINDPMRVTGLSLYDDVHPATTNHTAAEALSPASPPSASPIRQRCHSPDSGEEVDYLTW